MSKKPSPCPGCGGVKEAGRGRKFCDACRDRRRPVWERESAAKKSERLKALRAERRAANGQRPYIFRTKDAPPGTKWCSRCQQYLPVEDFPGTYRTNGKSGYCRDCYSSYLHERQLITAFGLDADAYATLFEHQDGRCFICRSKPRTTRLAVDHNHLTREVRGLLCKRCNQSLLGAGHEDPGLLRRAADYLENPPARALGLDVVVPDKKRRKRSETAR